VSLAELVALLNDRSIELSTRNGELVVRGKKQALTGSNLLELLREHKAALIELIEGGSYVGPRSTAVDVPPNLIPAGCAAIAPEMLPLITLTPEEIERIVNAVPGGAPNIQDIYPLAPLQEGILFHHLMAREGDPYLLRSLVAFDARARLENYLKALQAVIDRHDILRTGVIWEGLAEPVQVVWRKAPLVIEEVVLDAAVGDVARQLAERFDPRRYRLDVSQVPLLRIFIAEDKAKGRWLMLRLFHHLAIDHTTLEVMQQEVRAHLLGQADKLPAPLPFRNFVAQARLGISREEHETYFRKLLGDVEEPTAPFGVVDVQGDGSGITEARRAVDARLAKRLRERSRALGVSAASICHLAYAQVLARVSGRDDVVFGTVLFGRMQGGEGAARVMGLFINTLPVRIRVGEAGVEESVRSTHEQLAQLLRHEHASLSLAQRCSSVAAPAPLFSSLLNYRHSGAAAPAPAEARQAWEGVRSLGGEERTNYPFVVSVDDLGEGFMLTAQMQSPMDPARICEYMHRALGGLAEALESAPATATRSIDVLPGSERRQLLLEWNATKVEWPRAASVMQMFEEQAERTPDAVAVVYGDQRLTFGELNARANQLALYLQGRNVQRDTLVAICVERSLEMAVGLLGILKAGGAYVPLDPTYPAERLEFLLQDTGAALLLTQARLLPRLPAHDDALCLDSDWHKVEGLVPRAPRIPIDPEQLAYVIYTSGSTGKPKGVCITHRGLSNYLNWAMEAYQVAGGNGAPVHSSFAFDLTITSFFTPLLTGRSVHLLPEDRSVEALADALRIAPGYSLVKITPAHLQSLQLQLGTDQVAKSARSFVIGGEQLEAEAVAFWRRHAPDTLLVNEYGPTETVVGCCVYTVDSKTRNAGAIPIGRPIANTQLYILDRHREPVPIGVVGELYIGGHGVARGYWNQATLTAEKFVPDPFNREPGARLYRTGDLARYLSDGNIEFLGRIDNQVKVRGYRIELGEIESTLSQHPAIRESVVLAREDSPGDKRLVAYVAVTDPAADLPDQLRAHLRERLPEYMVPAAFVSLEQLPLTPNGKVDRKALPAPEYAGAEYVAPRNATEEKLAAIWAKVLKRERVGVNDNFFELGGHSLLAVTLIERMRRAGLNADVRALFTTPTLAELAAAVGGESGMVEVPPNRIPEQCAAITPEMLPLVSLTPEEIGRIVQVVPGGAPNIQDIYPLAPLQEGVLFHHLMAREGDPYLLYASASFDSRERLNSYLKALQSVIDRHDILRTGVVWEGLSEPVQVVWRNAPLVIEEVKLGAANGDVAQQLRARFDPRRYRLDVRQAPLLRAFIAEDKAKGRWVMQFLFHHLAIDHTALEVMHEEIQAHLLDRTDRLPAPLPFRNFVAQARLGVPREEHEGYFRKLLGDVEEPTVPFGLVDVQREGAEITEARLVVDAKLARRLRDKARALGVSAASVFHLAYAQVLARVSGREDVVFGTVLFGRMQGGEGAERVMGLFINTLPVRIRVGEAGVGESVRQTHTQLAQLLRHEHASLALAQRASRVAAPAPLFSALMNYRHSAGAVEAPSAEARRAWEGVRSLGGEERTNYPFVLSVEDLGEGFGLTAQMQSPLDPARICGYMHRALEGLVEALERAPATMVGGLEILSAPERRQLLLEWNATRTDYPREASIGELFEEQARRTPDAVALEYEGEELSYKELNSRASRLAHYLRKQGVTRETLVGLCVERSLEMVVATLAILKAGGAYVPLDPEYPKERLAFMLRDTEAPVLLTQARLRERLPAYAGKVIELDSDWREIARASAANPKVVAEAQSLAYVIYTSGSTGRPKGTLIEQRSVVRLVKNTNYIELGPQEVFLQFAPISFDASTLEIWGPLLNGGRLVIAPPGRLSLEELGRLIEERGVTTLWLTAALFNQMVDSQLEALRGVKQLLAGGEALSVPHVRKFLEGIGKNRLINGYGPTENTTFTCCHVMGAQTRIGHTVPIGRPIANTRVYILDAHQQPVPVGVYGELYIGGDGLSRGYLNQPQLTEEKFVPDPFNPGARLYRTGDLVRYTAEGLIEFQGRIDTQVKVRGYRIELGEIEAALGEHAAVRETVVLAREDSPGDKRLVAYVVGEASAVELKEHLAARLPSYMVPSAFVTLEALPLTPNGKVDRKALPAPEYVGAEYVAPRTPTEHKLAQIWAEVLKRERVSVNDNFFELGGDSILSLQVIAKAKRAGLQLRPKQIFEYQRLGELAAVAEGIAGPVAEQGLVTGDVPLTPIQHWFFEQNFADPHHWNQAVWLELRRELDPSLLVQAIKHLITHHDALRMRFRKSGTGWQQFNAGADHEVQWLTRVDLSGLDGTEKTVAVQRAAAELQRQLKLEEGPLLRAGWFDFGGSQPSRFLIVIHHLVVDGVSWRILLEDLQTACGQLRLGNAVRLPDKTTSFRRWAQRLTEYASSATIEREKDYWLTFSREATGQLPVDFPGGENTGASARTVSASLDAEETRTLLQRVPQVYDTQINDVLLSALAMALGRWSGESAVRIYLEGHGREELFEGVDLSRSVGWFTTQFPVRLDLGGSRETGDILKSVKEQLGRIPQRGIGFGLLRYSNGHEEPAARLHALPPSEVVFNYLGQFDQTLSADAEFTVVNEPTGPAHSLRARRSQLLSVNGLVAGGRLQLSWSYSENVHRRATIESVAGNYMEALRKLIRHCASQLTKPALSMEKDRASAKELVSSRRKKRKIELSDAIRMLGLD
jgi:amino acid adenylation domain-containing protein/non-ribosomal peptide synthase protein (TIGR01720 family)